MLSDSRIQVTRRHENPQAPQAQPPETGSEVVLQAARRWIRNRKGYAADAGNYLASPAPRRRPQVAM